MPQDYQVPLVLRVWQVVSEQLVPRELLVLLVQMDFLVFRACLALSELLVFKDCQVLMVLLVQLVELDSKAGQVLEAHKVYQVHKETLAHLVLQAIREVLCLVLQGELELQELQAQRVLQEILASLVIKVLLVFQELLVCKAH